MTPDDINSWSKFTSWKEVTPPSRPDSWQISICRKALASLSLDATIGVLGSTIEYRKLLEEMGFHNIYIFERNLDFYNYTNKTWGLKAKEIIVHGNWIDTLFDYQERFDVILSDLTSGNISYDNRYRFYNGICLSLRDSGLFFDRILTKQVPFIDLEKLIKKYSILEVNCRTVNSFNCEVMFCSTLLSNKECVVDTNCFYEILIRRNIPRISEFVKACYSITPRDCIWWYSLDWAEEEKLYKSFFSIIKKYDEPENSAYYKRAKFMISRRGDWF